MSGYGDSSIKQLKGAERVRKRPGVMFGSDDINGAFHTVKEIVGNSLDEARAGYGKRIEVTYHADGAISVRDYGRGVPMGWNEAEQEYNWHLIFNELYAGGKYDEDNEDYEFSLGLNGLGAAAVQYTSEYFEVISYRDKIYKKRFEKGYPLDDKLIEEPNTTGETGTYIKWKIDNEVFPNTNFTTRMFQDFLESQAHLNSVVFVFHDEKSGETYEYQGKGIESYLKDQVGEVLIETITKFSEKEGIELGKNYRVKCEVVLALTNETKSTRMFYHNTAEMRTGVHWDAFDDAMRDFFKDIGKQYGLTIIPYDYDDFVSVAVSTYSNITSFANQTKDGVSNGFVYDIIYATVKDILDESYLMKKQSFLEFIDNVINAANARKKAKEIEAQERLIRKVTTNKRYKPEKFVDCNEKDSRKRELFIVEGDSAMGSCKTARDSKFQAILPIKGKPMNGLKSSIEDLLNNKEIQDLVNTIGTGVDVADGASVFDIEKRQYDRIIIMTDADIDGNQIRVLLYTIFYRLMPKLLEEGYVYIAETPLFEIETSNGSLFAYSNDEKDKILEDCKAKGIKVKRINRSKGLGENNPDMLWHTTMNPDTRRLVQLNIDIKDQIVRDISNMLFGLDPNNERKAFVFSLLEAKIGEDASLEDLVETIESLESEREAESLEMVVE